MGYKFKNPPIYELVIGMSFKNILFDVFAITKFYEKVKGTYSKVEEKEPILFQTIEKPRNNINDILTDMKFNPDSFVRYWFINGDGSKLIQIQNNCFYLNWRKNQTGENVYPSFKSLLEEFKNIYTILGSIVGQDTLEKNAEFELTYYDHILADIEPNRRTNLDKIFDYFHLEGLTSDLDGFNIRFSKKLPDFDGRYDANYQSAILGKTKQNIVVVKTTIKGKLTEKYNNFESWFINSSYLIVEEFVAHLTEQFKKELGFYVSN